MENNTPVAPVNLQDPAQRPKKKTGMIIALCVGGGILLIGLVVLLLVLFIFSDNPVAGDWECYSMLYNDVSTDLPNKPSTELILNKDGSFTYGFYGQLEDNHVKGNSYSVTSEDKASSEGFDNFYIVKFGTITERVIAGKNKDTAETDPITEMEMGIKEENGKREAVIFFTNSYDMYYCYDKS